MMLQRTLFSVGLLASLGALVAFARPGAAPAASASPAALEASGTYAVDGGHSSVTFSTTHLGVAYAYGRFNDVGGSFVIDEADPSKSSIRVEIRAASIDTNSDPRDKHLRGSDFFDVEQFPEIVFESESVKDAGDGVYEVVGKLSAHGVTKPLTVQVEKVGHGDRGPRFGYRAGFRTGFTFKRTDYGMTYMTDNGMLGDAVDVVVSLEGVKQ